MTVSQKAAARRNAAVLGATAAAAGLLFLYPTSTNRGADQQRPGQAVATPGVVSPTPGGTASAGSSGSATTVVNGTSVDTRYGPVQVQLHVRGGKIVSATAIDYPQGSGRDQQINSSAIPILQQETIAAQSAQIDTVSGATFTSDGYRTSLQAALDSAHL